MLIMSRVLKQLIVASVYVFVFIGLSFWFYDYHYGPTCLDGIKNGQEEGIDCGTLACGAVCPSPVQAVQVQSVDLVKTPAGDYDLAMRFYNPNTDYGVAAGTYELTVGSQISPHDFYLLPGQTKYLVLTSLKGLSDSASAEVVIKSVQWQKVSGDPSVALISSNERYTVSGNQTIFETTVMNNSDFDLDSIDIGLIVSDSLGKILATNTTSIQTLLSHTQRYVKVSWPFVLPVNARVDTEIGTNVFNNSNFLKTHGTQEKFQQFF